METEHITRRLAAILAADIVGYSSLMEVNEDATVSAWKTARLDIIDPKIEEYSGHIVKHTGDGFLAEFSSVSDAVSCAIDMQKLLTEWADSAPEEQRIKFRMGVNIGDVVEELGDIHGDGVNIAARLEGLANPGGICVTASVYDQMHKKNGVVFEDLGLKKVKNISEPIHTYRICTELGDQEIISPVIDEPSKNSRRWLIHSTLALVVIAGAVAGWFVLSNQNDAACTDHLGLEAECPEVNQ